MASHIIQRDVQSEIVIKDEIQGLQDGHQKLIREISRRVVEQIAEKNYWKLQIDYLLSQELDMGVVTERRVWIRDVKIWRDQEYTPRAASKHRILLRGAQKIKLRAVYRHPAEIDPVKPDKRNTLNFVLS